MTRVDPSTNTAYLATSYNAKWANEAAGSRYQVQNALELLDEPGEYYFDRVNGKVYVAITASSAPIARPTDISGPTDIFAAGPVELIKANGTAAAPVIGVTFSNLSIAYAGRVWGLW